VADPGIKPSLVWDAKTKTRLPAVRHQKYDVAPWLDAGFGFAPSTTPTSIPTRWRTAVWHSRALSKPARPRQRRMSGLHRRLGLGMSRVMDYLETDKSVDAKRSASSVSRASARP